MGGLSISSGCMSGKNCLEMVKKIDAANSNARNSHCITLPTVGPPASFSEFSSGEADDADLAGEVSGAALWDGSVASFASCSSA